MLWEKLARGKKKAQIQTVRNIIQKHKQNKILTIPEVENYQYNTGIFNVQTPKLLLRAIFILAVSSFRQDWKTVSPTFASRKQFLRTVK